MTRARPILVVLLVAAPVLALDSELEKLARDPDPFKRSDAARRLGRDGSPRAARLLVELMEDADPYVRDRAVIAPGGLSDDGAVEAVAGGARLRRPLSRQNVAEALGRTGSAAALPALRLLATKDPAPEVRARALDWMWGMRGDAEALSICAAALGDGDPRVRAAAVETAGRIRAEGSLALVKRALDDPDEGVRCVARMELRFLAPAEALAGLEAAAKAPGWRTRAQAVDDAVALREAAAVTALLDLVGDEILRVSSAAHRALRALTGKDIARDPELWRAWWKEAKAAWRAPKGRLSPPEDRGGTAARFHGIDVGSARVVFLIDISGSMADAMPDDGEGRTRWDVVRAELARTLDALDPGTRVNVTVFAERTSSAFPALAKLTPRARKQLASFASRATPGRRGDLLRAMLEALERQDVDTIFLLSDGAPSAGDMVDQVRVRSAIRSRNRMLKRTVHTIGFGCEKEAERRFMEGVARDSGGVSVLR